MSDFEQTGEAGGGTIRGVVRSDHRLRRPPPGPLILDRRRVLSGTFGAKMKDMARDRIHCPKCMKDWLQPITSPGRVQRYACPSCGKKVELSAYEIDRRASASLIEAECSSPKLP